MCPHRSEFNTHIRFHPPNHLPEDDRSFSRNFASLNNVIQDKTNCSFESIQHTESTNLNIFRKTNVNFPHYSEIPGPTVTLDADKVALDFFALMFNLDLCVWIAAETNCYAEQLQWQKGR